MRMSKKEHYKIIKENKGTCGVEVGKYQRGIIREGAEVCAICELEATVKLLTFSVMKIGKPILGE